MQAVEAGAGLAAQLVVDADDGGFADARELIDELFDFARVDVLAHADDHVLEAIDDVDVALFVGAGDVARMEPAAAQRVLRRVGQVPVAEHDVVALDDELAGLTFGDFLAVGVNELPGDARNDGATGADFRLLGRVHRDDWRGLGKAVALADVDAELVHEVLLNLQRQRRAARDDEAQGGHVFLARELRQQAAD